MRKTSRSGANVRYNSGREIRDKILLFQYLQLRHCHQQFKVVSTNVCLELLLNTIQSVAVMVRHIITLPVSHVPKIVALVRKLENGAIN